MNIRSVKNAIQHERYEISLHAQKERAAEHISIEDIETAITHGEILEQYPKDSRGASCLILGRSQNRPIHIVCSFLPNQWLRIITVYIPHRHKWINPRQRRK